MDIKRLMPIGDELQPKEKNFLIGYCLPHLSMSANLYAKLCRLWDTRIYRYKSLHLLMCPLNRVISR